MFYPSKQPELRVILRSIRGVGRGGLRGLQPHPQPKKGRREERGGKEEKEREKRNQKRKDIWS